ncbi:MAG: DUF4625 domain-containing protein [Marinilabiliaceae bacterium]|jgi:hypothetical protein|nr:hypothetical protein [Bacteroidales bacterium]MCR5695958.1 DUF4625 domain-containing protein [Marinilabiliaceae bacterium]
MKKYINNIAIIILSFVALSFSSCDKDDNEQEAAPTVTIEEANIEGDYLCTEAEIDAPGRVASITVSIVSASDDSNVKLTKTFTDSKYVGVLNIPEFHEHITGIDNVVVGDILRLTVTDNNGNSTTAQKNITEEEEEEEEE